MSKNAQTGLAGEFYVLAQLAHRRLVGTMTLSHTKGVDILLMNPTTQRLFKLEVKTSNLKPKNEKLFGKNYCWPMSKKHERLKDENLYFCFVRLLDKNSLPEFYIVPSNHVAKRVRNHHKKWLRKGDVKDNNIRRFRIPVNDPNRFKNDWAVFSR